MRICNIFSEAVFEFQTYNTKNAYSYNTANQNKDLQLSLIRISCCMETFKLIAFSYIQRVICGLLIGNEGDLLTKAELITHQMFNQAAAVAVSNPIALV